MPRCYKCNKKVDRLYNGRCTGCMSELVLSENIQINAMLNEISPELLHLDGEMNKPGGFAKAFKRTESEKKMLETLYNKKMEITSKSERVYQKALDRAGLTEKEKKAYMPSLKQLFKKYEPMFLNGTYYFCKKKDYGSTEEMGGTVVESKGGIVVFKKTEYYDDKHMVVNPYAADDEEVGLTTDEEIELNLELGLAQDLDETDSYDDEVEDEE